MSWPVGREHVCFDATVLVHYQDNEHLDTLRDLFDGRRCTPNVVTGYEPVKNKKARELNERILAASWESVPVDDPAGIQRVAVMRALWNSNLRRTRGEPLIGIRGGSFQQRHEGGGAPEAKDKTMPAKPT